MVDPTAKGLAGTEFGMAIERGKIREFAAATGSRDPAYLLDPAPVIPATFLTTAIFWQDGDADPWRAVRMDPTRGLHAEQEFIFHGPPPRAGDQLRCQARIDDVYDKQGRSGTLTFVVQVTEFRDPSGRLVAESRLTGVETSPFASSAASGSPAAVPSPAKPATAQPPAIDGPDASPAPLVYGPLTRTDAVRYQGASGDFYAVHHDEPYALAAGLPAPLMLGMFSAGLLATWATGWLGAENIRRYRMRFSGQVFPGDTLTCTGAITGHGTQGRELELTCTTQTGAVAVRAWATFANVSTSEYQP